MTAPAPYFTGRTACTVRCGGGRQPTLVGPARAVRLRTPPADPTERMVKKETQLEAEIAEIRKNVDALLDQAERVDAEEDERFGPENRGDELPEELQRRETRLAKIKEAKEALEREAREAETARRAELEARGKQEGVSSSV